MLSVHYVNEINEISSSSKYFLFHFMLWVRYAYYVSSTAVHDYVFTGRVLLLFTLFLVLIVYA